jgi:hypothetical protein
MKFDGNIYQGSCPICFPTLTNQGPPLDLVGAGKVYEAMVGLVGVNDGFPPPTGPEPFEDGDANYGLSEILIVSALQQKNINEMIKLHGGDNFDEEIQQVVTEILLPTLNTGIMDRGVAAAGIQFFATNIISHILTGTAYIP